MEVVEEGGNYVCTLREARLGDPMTVSLAFLTNKKELAGSRRPACIVVRCLSVAYILRSVSPRCEYVCSRFEAAISHAF